MRFPWFVWNNVDSRDMGLLIAKLPDIVRPAERIETVTIPGRAGSLRVVQGEEIYEPYSKTVSVTALPDADYGLLLRWLQGSGQVVFSNEPDRVYDASIIRQVSFSGMYAGLRGASIEFYVQPFKHFFPPPSAMVALTNESTVTNPGDVTLYPRMYIEGAGACELYVGDKTLNIDGYSGGYGWTIDSAAKRAVNSTDVSVMDRLTGDLPALKPGQTAIGWSSGITTVKILPDWLYL